MRKIFRHPCVVSFGEQIRLNRQRSGILLPIVWQFAGDAHGRSWAGDGRG
jgi:hypothetical protein